MRSALGSGGIDRRELEPPGVEELAGVLPGLEVIELIGRGGMGFVYKARQRSLDRLVAVKLFPRDAYAGDPTFAERFAQEARVLASLNHPNIVAAHEFGESERYCYLVMELVEGRSLREWTQAAAVTPAESVAIARQVCEALAYAHARGVIHRDIKPENILLENRRVGAAGEVAPRVRVADFGLAKLAQRKVNEFSMTGSDRLMGTPDYMAPEQRDRPGEVDARADLYALGVVLYEMLSGRLPLGRFAPPTADGRLNRIVLRCLEAEPGRRFASAAEVGREVERAGARRPVMAWAIAAAAVVAIAGGAAMIVLPRWLGSNGPVGSTPTNVWIGPTTKPMPATAATTPSAGRPMAVRDVSSAPFAMAPPWANQFAPTIEDFHTRMVREYGEERIVRVTVDELHGDYRSFLSQRLRELSGASAAMSSGSGPSVLLQLAPVRDVEGLAGRIDFGTVTSVDAIKREIVVRADAAKLPPPLPPAVKTPNDPNFYARNLADLAVWDKARQAEALERLAKAEPTQPLREPIVAEMKRLAADPTASLRRAAVTGLARWGGVGTLDVLSGAMRDDDASVRRTAFEAAASLKDARAAKAIAGAMERDRSAAGAALRRMGAVAEEAAIGLLDSSDMWVRLEGVRVLEEVGTSRSLPALQKAARSTDGLVKMGAERAIKAVESR
jgi:serine/threonine protein kinase